MECKKRNNVNRDENKNIKKYLKDFFVFLDTKLKKNTLILLIVSVLIIAITLIPFVSVAEGYNCENMCRDESATILSEYGDKVAFLALALVAGFVPYLYLSVAGFGAYIVYESVQLSYIIAAKGYLLGTIMGIVPLLINILLVSLVTSCGIYICRNSTASDKVSKATNMNLTNFRINLYQAIGNTKKEQELIKKRDEKITKLKNKQEKTKYIQLLNVVIITAVIQFISVVIQEIIL